MKSYLKNKKNECLCTMKHMVAKTNSCRQRLVLALLLSMLLPWGVSAQEMLRTTSEDLTTEFSLARIKAPFQEWIVYNENAGMSLFGWMDTAGYVNHFVNTQQQIHVKDMEIAGNELYFCGTMFNYELMSDVGVMGYFTISDLLSPSTMKVNYIFFNEFKDLRRMVYFSTPQTKHVAMVGTGEDGRDYIADAYFGDNTIFQTGGVWNRAWTYMPNIDALFDDIAFRTDTVYVSARVENATEVQVCLIPISGMVGVPFFGTSGPVYTIKVPDAPTGRVLLQKAEDGVYAAYRSGPYLDVCRFQNFSNNASVRIPILTTGGYFPEMFTLKDLCTDAIKQDEISALVTKVYSSEQHQRVYHIPTSSVQWPGPVTAHEYYLESSYYPMSLCGGKDYHTVTVGRYLNKWGMARVVNPLFEDCTIKLSQKATEKAKGFKAIRKVINTHTETAEVLQMPVNEVEYHIESVCGILW